MPDQPDSEPEPIIDLERCRHGHTAGEYCEACDELDLRDTADTKSRDTAATDSQSQ